VSADRWLLLSTWHNAWLAADTPTRERLRAEFGVEHPELTAQADALASASTGLAGFLETPALVLAARDLTQDDPLLTVDALVGPYRIVGLLARGGMGDVYRATDVRLRRDVALKVLAHNGTDDVLRSERFLREARITASFDHANIIKVFDVGMVDGRPYLVAELLDGETLRGRLERGPMSTEDARKIAGEVAAGLVVAHAASLVHRDLKPENVFLTRSGVTKILDFGIAKLTADAGALDSVATLTGVLFGTAGYLAPEQIRGDAVDGRTDLFALGSMLFEMLTGQRAFARGHTVDTLHAILHEAPPELPASANLAPELSAVVMRLLEKEASRRFQSAADLAWALAHIAWAHDGPSIGPRAAGPLPGVESSDAPAARSPWRPRAAVTIAAAVVAAIGIVSIGRAVWSGLSASDRRETVQVVQFLVFPPRGNRFGNDPERTHLAFSPDGSQLAFIARASDGGVPRIWLRPMASDDARPLDGTDGARSLFWSLDGRSLAFFADDKLKRLDLPDGAVVPVCPVNEVIGLTGTWGADGDILFGSVKGEVILGVSARGGTPVAVLRPDRARGEVRVNWPWFLPDGRRFLYQSRRRDGSGQVMLGERGRPSRLLLPAVSNAQWMDPDLVVFVRDGTLLAQRVDLDAARIVGEPIPIAGSTDYIYSTARAEFATSRTGHVVYQTHTDMSRLVWRDRAGMRIREIGRPGNYQSVRLAPDGRVLVERYRPGLGTPDVLALDETRGEARLTWDAASETKPILLRDGVSLLFMADRDGNSPNVFRKNLTTGAEKALAPAGQMQWPEDVSANEQTLAYAQRTPRGNFDILTLALDAPGTPSVLLGSPFDETGLRFSPDGHAAAFISDESEHYEVYVAPFPAMTPRVRVSARGGRALRWNPAGRELIYLSNDGGVVSVRVQTTPSLELGTPTTLFVIPRGESWLDFAVSADGERFLTITPDSRGDEQPLRVIRNWSAGTPLR
jgi:eukaryotic-like serine/threonine-protein kinase